MITNLNVDGFAASLERLKAELPGASREAVHATAEASLDRISRPTYWANGSGKGNRASASFRVVMVSDYASRVSSQSPVALFLDGGTKAHRITAKKKMLRFTQNGSVRFARSVWHPGTSALNYSATEQIEGQRDLEINGGMALGRAVERAGLG